MTSKVRELLAAGARNLGVDLTPADLARFAIYLDELLIWNEVVNLTAITDPARIVTDLFLDSMLLHPLLRPGAQVLDIGSGAGFPGLILALVGPESRFTLVEARQRKASFLEHLVRRFGLKNCRVSGRRLPDRPPLAEAGYDLVCGRAVAEPEAFLGLAGPWVRPGGLLVLMLSTSQPTPQPAPGSDLDLTRVEDKEVPGAGRLTRLVVFRRRS
ncbi:MAG: 16S rRNA (guanine(527)-N(7))-methyltransferase RsmG [Proteobacteria bacterium]|nr:16S rRNA (guanine(527)-N(7))-methyltransferase RsmG [Pseudomonadota bacterium]MBU1741283.1 16S rRNA (guanine(527)-N(7))-methyltransferase RsmG [Pseudomonadota bacterium]